MRAVRERANELASLWGRNSWRESLLGRVVLVASFIAVLPFAINAVFPRNPPIGILLNGVVIGSLYSLIAVGLVLVYRANRIVNFAQAGMGAVPAVAALILFSQRDWPYVSALVITVVGALALGALIDVAIIRRFGRAPRLILTVVTIGVAQLLAFVEFFTPKWISGNVLPPTRFSTPFTGVHTEIGGVVFTGDHLVTVIVVIGATAALGAFFRYTRVGVAVRASAENGDRALLVGIPVRRVVTVVWMIAALLSALGVFLRAPLVGLPLGSLIGPSILLFALAAAVIARMDSLPLAMGAGMLIGVLDQAAFFSTRTSEISNALMLPVILLALLLQRKRISRAALDTSSTWHVVREFRPIPVELRRLRPVVAARVAAWVVAGALLAFLPFIVGDLRREAASLFLIYAMIAVSLVILTGWAGQISLGQFAFSGVGAAVAGGLAADAGADFFVSLLAAGLVGAAVAVAVGVPALRVQGLFLAVATLAFAANAESFFLNRRYFAWLLPEQTNPVERPLLFGRLDLTSDLAFYYVCLVGLVIAALVARSLRHGRSGRLFIGSRDNRNAVQAFGVNVARTRLAAFAISGFLAALGGALFAYLQGAVDSGVFVPAVSVQLFATAVIGGLTSIAGAVAGAAYVVGFQRLLPDYQLLATGVGMLFLLLVFPGGLAEIGFRARDAFLRRVAAGRGVHVPSLVADSRVADALIVDVGADLAAPTPAEASGRPAERALLEVRGLDVSYDSVQVLFGVDFDIHEGEVLALLGTNGAGKSTLLRAVSGLVPSSSGTIHFDGQDVTGAAPMAMAAAGVVQMPGGRGVFPTLTVTENLKTAAWLSAKDPDHVAAGIRSAFERFPVLGRRGDDRAGDLSGGEQQMLALAMAFMMRPRLLMIDELSLGLAPTMVEQLLEIVGLIHEQGTTVVLVEQSINVALSIADRAYFMEKGEVRFSGPTEALLERDDIVRAVFLGGAGVPHARTPSSAKRRNTRRAAAPAAGRGSSPPASPALDVRMLRRSFGGITAVEDVSFAVAPREIVGLIGHNGAGKTTVLDLVSGFLAPDAGRVVFEGRDITTNPPERRAQAGLGRSFQDARVFPSLTVAENIAVSLDRHLDVRDHLASALHLPAAAESEDDTRWTVDDIVELMGLGGYRNKLAGDLSTGTRRIVDLAMAIGHDSSVLLLDEPSAGIAQRETEALGPVLAQLRDETGCAMLVIDHDMPLMQFLCDRLVALETGTIIAEGLPRDVVVDPRVVESYLGGSLTTINRSSVGKSNRPRKPRARARAATGTRRSG